ncbi:MAG: hypothetical protein D6732_18115 [Methanobacteriota archaeon]|nr:MAG: hypothetical protein D6732_18115 [Euryarchaeota archaeon]
MVASLATVAIVSAILIAAPDSAIAATINNTFTTWGSGFLGRIKSVTGLALGLFFLAGLGLVGFGFFKMRNPDPHEKKGFAMYIASGAALMALIVIAFAIADIAGGGVTNVDNGANTIKNGTLPTTPF